MTILIAGVDEAGRGPLVGSVFAAAVILPEKYDLPGLDDSKKLSEKKRDELEILIKNQAIAYAISFADNNEILRLNILHATMAAMKRAIEMLNPQPQSVLIDGNRIPKNLSMPAQAIIGGDAKIAAISAASILAKTARDREMYELHEQFPQYGFNKHKGYGTKAHLVAIERYGVLPQHRRDFAPVRNRLQQNSSD